MLSRRTILAWFGIGAAAAALPKAILTEAPQVFGVVDTAIPPRMRAGWMVRLEPDGSSTLVDGEKRFLEEWVKSGDIEKMWSGLDKQRAVDMVEQLKETIQTDIEAIDVRANPFREADQFRSDHGLEPLYREAKIYRESFFEHDFGSTYAEENKRRAEKVRGYPLPKMEERYISLDSPNRFSLRNTASNPDLKMFSETLSEKLGYEFGYTKDDYWETYNAIRTRPATAEEIARADATGTEYWKPKPLVGKDVPIYRSA